MLSKVVCDNSVAEKVFIFNFCTCLNIWEQHISYHSYVHHLERRKRKKKRFNQKSKSQLPWLIESWFDVLLQTLFFAVLGKVNPERRISLTRAAYLRGGGIILQRVTGIDLEGEGSVARRVTKYVHWDPKVRVERRDGCFSLQGRVLGTWRRPETELLWSFAHIRTPSGLG